MNLRIEELGSPDIEIAGLQIWIHSRQFPEIEEYWDANWVLVTAYCELNTACVMVKGHIIHLPEIESWLKESETLYKTLKGAASLSCIEPELGVTLNAVSGGSINMQVFITPNNMAQEHKFTFEIDQSYLPKLIQGCKSVLAKYPIKGVPQES